jgi:hypothetical protein
VRNHLGSVARNVGARTRLTPHRQRVNSVRVAQRLTRARSTGRTSLVPSDLTHAGIVECEAVIQRFHDTWQDAGRALLRIRNGELYRPRYRNFEHYCQARWSFTTPRAHQLIAAAETVEVITSGNLNGNGHVPNNERVTRELAPLRSNPETMRAAWHEARTEASREGREPTSTDVRRAVRGHVLGPESPVPTEPEPGSDERVQGMVQHWNRVCGILGDTIGVERDLRIEVNLTNYQRTLIEDAKREAWRVLDNEQN